METTSTQLRAEKKPQKEQFNPVKHKFLQKHEKFTDIELIKEQLFEKQIQTGVLQRIQTDINTVKWIVVISFITSIIVAILISIE